MPIFRFVLILFILIAAAASTAFGLEYNFTILNYNGNESPLYGISGSNIVGFYSNTSQPHSVGLRYDLNDGTWHTFTYNNEPNTTTAAYAIDGSKIIGYTISSSLGGKSGYIYDYQANAWDTFNYPGNQRVTPFGTDGTTIVGYYDASWTTANVGFVYNISAGSWSDVGIDVNGSALFPTVRDVSGDIAVGYYTYDLSTSGLIYNTDTETYETVKYPGSNSTYLYGIDGTEIVGFYSKAGMPLQSFVYDYVTKEWTIIEYADHPEFAVQAMGIDDGKIVGYCTYNGDGFGFAATSAVPEPLSVFLLSAGLFGLVIGRRFLK